jgi:hypothetical protein
VNDIDGSVHNVLIAVKTPWLGPETNSSGDCECAVRRTRLWIPGTRVEDDKRCLQRRGIFCELRIEDIVTGEAQLHGRHCKEILCG